MPTRVALATLAVLTAAGCSGATLRRADQAPREYPAGVTQVRWRTQIHEHGLFEPRPEECASGAVVGDRLVIGSRAGQVVALSLADGQKLWTTPVTGGVDSEARYDETHRQVYFGTDDGFIYAIDAQDGKVRWSYKGRGAVERRPELGGDAVYFSTASDRMIALDPRSGKALWQYEREAPEGFTIHGHAGPRLARGIVYGGFSDGFMVALNAGTGDVVWARSLAAASEQYVDVDATPAVLGDDVVISASYSGGLYALATANGDLRWRLNVEGASGGAGHRQPALLRRAPRRADRVDHHRRRALAPGAGRRRRSDAAAGRGARCWCSPAAAAASSSSTANSGRLLETFNPGRGMCAGATVGADGRSLYVLANSGSVYALSLIY